MQDKYEEFRLRARYWRTGIEGQLCEGCTDRNANRLKLDDDIAHSLR